MNANTNNNAASGQNEDYLDKGAYPLTCGYTAPANNTRSRRRREEVRWFYGTEHREEPRCQREDRKSMLHSFSKVACSCRNRLMEPATCSKKPPASMSPRSSPTRASPPPTRLSLDVDKSTHPPSTCYEDAHVADTSPKSTRSRTFSIGSIGHKKKHKNRESIDSTASHDSNTTTDETHGEDDGEKTGILHKVATGMQKARPYVERLSGTYEPMPTQPPDHTK